MKFLIAVIVILTGLHAAAEDKERVLGFTNESELGYVVTGGNSQSETTSFKETAIYNWTWDSLRFTGHYIQASGLVDAPTVAEPNNQEQRTTAENWSAGVRYEKVLTPKWFDAFVGHAWRGDRFQGVNYGYDSDIGVKYFTANSESFKQFFELGYRYTREFLVANPCTSTPLDTTDDVGAGNCGYPEFHYARLYGQADYAHSKTMSLGLWVEYLPSVINFSKDQRINFSPYLTSVLTDIFSLKVSYLHRYRFEKAPGAIGNNDFTFTTALLAKF